MCIFLCNLFLIGTENNSAYKMPPKKKKGKKSGKKGKKSGKASAKEGGGKSEHLSELSKEFYLIQIRDLENRLTR